MTIDIEKLIEEIDEDGSGEIEFDESKALLQSDQWIKEIDRYKPDYIIYISDLSVHINSF